jgi:hypothetical protein
MVITLDNQTPGIAGAGPNLFVIPAGLTTGIYSITGVAPGTGTIIARMGPGTSGGLHGLHVPVVSP